MFLAASACLAQTTPTIAAQAARARRLLASSRWADKAWGAYFAAATGDTAFTGPLTDALRQAAPLQNAALDSPAYMYVQSLFDALIQLGAQVPSGILLPFERQWRNEVLILLARQNGNGTANEDALFAMTREDLTWQQWIAICDFLYRMHSQRFFRNMLENLPLQHYIYVEDKLSQVLRCGGSSGIGLTTPPRIPSGFPPIGSYDLDLGSYQGETIGISGPYIVYYQRRVHPAGSPFAPSGLPLPRSQNLYLPRFIPHLGTRSNDEIEKLFYAETYILWTTPDAFSRDAARALNEQASAIAALIQDAHRFGLGDVSGITLTITPEVTDYRKTPIGPLPPVPPKQIVLK